MSSRDLTAGMAAEIVKKTVRPILLYECTLSDNTVARYWTGYGSLIWNGNTYTGTGNLIGITPVEETDDIKAAGVTATLSGVSSANVSLALQSLASGKQGIVRLAMLDSSNAIISTPRILFKGRLDGATSGGEDVTNPVLGIIYEHELSDLQRPREVRLTHEAQLARALAAGAPGDLGFQFIAQLVDWSVPWGKTP